MGVGPLLVVFRSLRHRNFRLYYLGQLTSLHGTWMQTVAQAWLVYRLTNSSFMLGLVSFFNLLPVLLLGLLGGVTADRFSRRRLMIVAQSAAMLQALLLGTLTLGGWVRPWQILVLATLLGIVQAFEMPARHSFINGLVPREDLANAIALNSGAFNVARFLGPAIAGWLVLWYGEGTVFLINAASFLAVLTSLLLIRETAAPRLHSDGSVMQHLHEGLQFAWQRPRIRAALLMVSAISLLASCVLVLMPVFAKEVFASGPRVLGLLFGATGVGALAGALRLAHRRSYAGLDATIGVAALIASVSASLFAQIDVLWLALLILVLAGAGQVSAVASANTLIQLTAEDEVRGRVMSLFAIIFIGFMPFGSLLAGVLAHSLGAPATVTLFALFCAMAAMVYLRLRGTTSSVPG
jgi:MFS family permease